MNRTGSHYEPKEKRMFGKIPLTVIAVALLFVFIVGGTVAFLATRTAPVENQFVPATVSCTVEENATATSKSDVRIKNTGNVDAYIRAYVVCNFVKDDGTVCGSNHAAFVLPALGEGWQAGSDGIYYYANPVKPGETTAAPLFSGAISLTTAEDGCKLQVEIVASAIQAEGTGATSAVEAWSKTPVVSGN